MNENFASRYFGGIAAESKVAVARQLLGGEFVQRRQNDFFGMISFGLRRNGSAAKPCAVVLFRRRYRFTAACGYQGGGS
jgi:hypothetical protein